ncbi:MAG: HAD family hydrolase [Caldilineae bacterium]|nr:MAG: HAD family hydrolase [Caldilineae bacterium]
MSQSTPIRAVLLDLDGTLIANEMRAFLAEYFALISSSFAHLVPADRLPELLIRATRAMIEDQSNATNQEVFERVFPQLVGHPWSVLEPVFRDFYEREFPRLRPYVRKKPQARPLLEWLFAHDFPVVVATNPLFPLTAIRQRMVWGEVHDFPYTLITAIENSRSAKPHLRYFRDILDTVSCRPEEVLVVGDENNDMVAGHLGCRTFLIPGANTHLQPDTPPPTYQGGLADVLSLLQEREQCT